MRKTFLLGGNPYTAPDPIGAGIRARISQITGEIADEKKVPNETGLIKRYYYEYTLRLLEILLMPEPNSVSVKEAYDIATDEEVQDVMTFFQTGVTGKTKSASGKINALGNSKRTAKQST